MGGFESIGLDSSIGDCRETGTEAAVGFDVEYGGDGCSARLAHHEGMMLFSSIGQDSTG